MTDGLEPWRPHAWQAAVSLFSQMLPDEPQREHSLFTEGIAWHAPQDRISRVRLATFVSGLRQTGQWRLPRRSFDSDDSRFCGWCGATSLGVSFLRHSDCECGVIL